MFVGGVCSGLIGSGSAATGLALTASTNPTLCAVGGGMIGLGVPLGMLGCALMRLSNWGWYHR
jgi:hypothetical protein